MASELDKFLEERSKIPIPTGDVAWVKLLAKELAIGANRNLWSPRHILDYLGRDVAAVSENVNIYFGRRWPSNDLKHILETLLSNGYLARPGERKFPYLTTKAYDLLEETEPYNIFISYRRLDSSALALLVLSRLKEHELIPFVDMALEAGGNWHADLEKRIKNCDYFIILLGKDTLSSAMTVKEIQWALKFKKPIIPVWHGGFALDSGADLDIETGVKVAIQETNAIRVTDESASGYNTAIVELLNRFGITP